MNKITLMTLLACTIIMFGCNEGSSYSTTQNTSTKATTIVSTTAATTQTTTIPTTIPTTQPAATTAPTVYIHHGPLNTDGKLEYTPEGIPEVYWKVLNNRQAIYFSNSCSGPDHHSGPCFGWLDDYRFPYIGDELAACRWLTYAVVDMDGDGKEELLINGSDTLVLREKDGIIYGYSFIFRNMELVYADGTFTSYYGGNGVEYSRNQLSFNEDNSYNWIQLCQSHDIDEFNSKFYINRAEVSEKEYMDYENTLIFQEVVWNKLGRYPIREPEIPGG